MLSVAPQAEDKKMRLPGIPAIAIRKWKSLLNYGVAASTTTLLARNVVEVARCKLERALL